MTQLVYDSGFAGFLTCVFEVYERKLSSVQIVTQKLYHPRLNAVKLEIISDPQKAERVWLGMKRRVSVEKLNEIYKTFLSEQPDVENILLQYIRLVFKSTTSIEGDYGEHSVIRISQLARQVDREKHRMEAFVRFQRTQDDLYHAAIEPDFNVLPLIAKHFKDRYADQHWIIYDVKRDYGIRYNKQSDEIQEVEIIPAARQVFLPDSIVHEEEIQYQQLWRQYFSDANIAVRKNTKLHVRHVPLRYWKYLTEKVKE